MLLTVVFTLATSAVFTAAVQGASYLNGAITGEPFPDALIALINWTGYISLGAMFIVYCILAVNDYRLILIEELGITRKRDASPSGVSPAAVITIEQANITPEQHVEYNSEASAARVTTEEAAPTILKSRQG